MNILFISDDFYPKTGGVAQYDHSIAKALALNNHKVWVLTAQGKASVDLDCKIISFPKLKILSSLIPFIFALGIIIFNRIDVVILGYFMSTLGLGGLMGKKLGFNKLITVVCGYDLVYSRKTAADKYVANRIMRNADMVWADSNFTGQVVCNEFNNKSKIRVLYPTVQSQYLEKEPVPGKTNKHKILTVCRLVTGKGLEMLLDAFVLVKNKVPEAMLEIVGEGPLLDDLKDKTIELNIKANVTFSGRLTAEELLKAYDGCDIFVMASETDTDGRFEGFGIVFLEANARGKPVVGTRNGGITEAIAEWQTGVITEPGDVTELAEALMRLLSDDRQREEIGKKGRERVKEYFTLNKMACTIQEYLKMLND